MHARVHEVDTLCVSKSELMWIIQSLNHICLGSQWPMEAGHLGQSSCVCVCSVETCWWSLNDAWAEPSCRAVERIDLFLHQWPETSSSLPCRSCASTRLFFSPSMLSAHVCLSVLWFVKLMEDKCHRLASIMNLFSLSSEAHQVPDVCSCVCQRESECEKKGESIRNYWHPIILSWQTHHRWMWILFLLQR